MNFKDKQVDLQLLLESGSRTNSKEKKVPTYNKGVYIFSRKLNDDVHKIGVAFGSGGIYERLKSYKICYPFKDEFYIQYIITCETVAKAKRLEKTILKNHRLKNVATNIVAQGKTSQEHKFTSKNAVLKDVLVNTLNEHKGIWEYVAVFGEKGWKIIQNRVDKNVTGLAKPSSSYNLRPKLAKDYKGLQFKVVLPDKLRVGMKFDTKWGKATVEKVYKNGDIEASFGGYPGTYTVNLH